MKQEKVIASGVPVPEVVATPPAAKKKHSRSGAWKRKGSAEYREKDKEYRREVREAEYAERNVAAKQPQSDRELRKSEAKEVLRERGLRNVHVIDTVVELAEVASKHFRIPFNDFLLRKGLRYALAIRDGKEAPAAPASDQLVLGEVIWSQDAFALWDFTYWRRPESYPEWLQLRFRCKNDCYFLGKEILGKADFSIKHEEWRDFFPRFDSKGLTPEYTESDLNQWLGKQCEKRQYFQAASRGAFKTTFAHCWLTSAICCCGDLRILIATETKDLAEAFIKSIRAFFEVRDPNNPSHFNELFPEHSIPYGESRAETFASPMAKLGRPAPTCRVTSQDSSVAGGRADIYIADDFISNLSTGSEKMRQQSLERYDYQRKLLTPTGICVTLGTFYHPEDIYAELQKRADGPTKPIEIQVDPCWIVKPHATKKDILELRPEDVDLVFPHLDFNYLKTEAHANLPLFKSQHLLEFQSDELDDKIHFDLTTLQAAVRPAGFEKNPSFQYIRSILGIDAGYSTSPKADYSALTVVQILYDEQKKKYILWVSDLRIFRMRHSELAAEICKCVQENRPAPTQAVCEKNGAWESLQYAISEQARLRELPLPIFYWKPCVGLGIGLTKNKAARIKALEVPLANGQLYFKQQPLLEEFFHQLTTFTGGRSTPTKKDDMPDSLSLIYTTVQSLFVTAPQPTDEEIKAQEDLSASAVRMATYNRMFGSEMIPFAPKSTEPEPAPQGPFERAGLYRFGPPRRAA